MSNEAFHLLSRGGVTFDKSKSQSLLFNVCNAHKHIFIVLTRRIESQNRQQRRSIPREA